MKPIAIVDFETEKVERRPRYPPKPVGVAIQGPDGKRKYWAWGHASENNCTREQAAARLSDTYHDCTPVFHNAQFDLDVGNVHLGLSMPASFHDTLYLAFLKNPHERSLELKQLAPKYLGIQPDARDRLQEWIQANIKGAKRGKTTWKEHIAQAPGKLAGEYACDDLRMTHAAFEKFYPEIKQRGMLVPYRRELQCLPITVEMERCGVRVDVPGLERCGSVFAKAQKAVYAKIARKLKVGETFNLNSGQQLAAALVKGNFLRKIQKTPKGQIATGMDVLTKNCTDKDLLQLLGLHSVLEKSQNTFIQPWLEQAALSGGRILPKFNQTRGGSEDDPNGTRSGRYSSSDPNLQQVPADVAESRNKDILLALQAYLREEFQFNFTGLRAYILPDEGTECISVDYSQQELRILAHFENGQLAREYRRNPKFDPHQFIQGYIKEKTGNEYPRKFVKVTVFSRIYGAGVKKVQTQLGCDWDTAEAIYNGISDAVPGMQRLIDDLKELSRKDLPHRTWGGREYFAEEDHYDAKTGQWWNFDYKRLNYLIQPSAADMTKQGMIQARQAVPEARIAVQVHDELLCMGERGHGKRIAEALCDMKLNVPILAEPKYSRKNWGDVK